MYDVLSNVQRRTRISSLWVAMFTSSMLCASVLVNQVYAGDCETVSDPIVYDATSGDVPDEATPAWDAGCGDNVYVSGTIVGDFLHVNDESAPPDSYRACYTRNNVFLCATQDAVFEIVVKTMSGDSDPPHVIHDISLICGFSDGVQQMTLVITPNRVGFWTLNPQHQVAWLGSNYYEIDTTDALHCIRVEKHGEDQVDLIVDGCLRVDVDYDDLHATGNTSENKAYLLATSTQGTAEFDVASFRYRNGADFFPGETSEEADLNDDEVVDTLDLGILLAAWGDCPSPPASCPADFNDDGVVNTLDLGFCSSAGRWRIPATEQAIDHGRFLD